MDQAKLIPMARKQLKQAEKTLRNEMRQFFADRSSETFSELERLHERDELDWDYGWEDDPHWGSYNDQYQKQQKEQWSSPESWETFTDTWERVEQGIRQRADSFKTNSRLDEDRQLLETMQLLADKLQEAFDKVAQQAAHPLVILTDQAELLRVFTEISAVYRTAWEQRHPIDYSDWASPSERDLSDVILVGDGIVQSFYRIVRDKNLDLAMPDQKIIVVPHRSRMYASGFEDLPMPYIVAPRFGSEQIWTWLAYVHEVGHHVYRNVKGLRDELAVNVMMTLGSLGKDTTMQSIWFRWLEEIFADLFGLLQVGRAYAASQQRMLLYIPSRAMEQSATYDDPREGLLRAPDDTHPPAHLRTHLAIQALRIINTSSSSEKLPELQERWDGLFLEGEDVGTTDLHLLVQGVYKKFPFQEMFEIGETVLEVMLTTELYALEKHKLKDVFVSHLDEQEVRTAAGLTSLRMTAVEQPPSMPEFQYLLTAAQDELDRVATHLTADGKHIIYEDKLYSVDASIQEIDKRYFKALKERALQEMGGGS
jgi:hypothetical protein